VWIDRATPCWSSDRRFGKSLDEQKRHRDQRSRDARAEASTEYLADIASDGPDCEDD
jgi:hypothetical protein